MNNSILTSIILYCSSLFVTAGEPEDFFLKLSKKEFAPLINENTPTSGWMMKTENGEKVGRWTLNRQVDLITEYGILAVPECIKRLSDKKMYIRYIAAESLSRITKKTPIWYSFGTPNQKFNGNETWSNDATLIWKQWYKDKLDAKQKQLTQ